MDTATRTEISKLDLYRDYLTREGYRPSVDSDGDVVFKREGKTYLIIVDEKDKSFFRIILPNFWKIEDDNERLRILEACDYANSFSKVAKIHTVKDNVWAVVELFLAKPQDFEPVFERSCRALDHALSNFADKMKGGAEKKVS